MTIAADDMRQLAEFDVPAAVLAAPGERLIDLLGERGAANVDDLRGPPPADGWRVIAGDLSAPELHPPTLAAPSTGRERDQWTIVGVHRREGEWRSVVRLSDHVVRPGRATRRDGLELDWVESPTVSAVGTVPTVRLELRNVGRSRWLADGLNNDLVLVWTSGPADERVVVPGSVMGMVGFRVRPLPSLDRGSAVVLTASWSPLTVEKLPAGDYPLEAELKALELPSSPGVLQIR